MQGRKLGLQIINALVDIGRVQGCYKIILDCSKDNIPYVSPRASVANPPAFYEKCGQVISASAVLKMAYNPNRFQHKEYEMVKYLDKPAGNASAKL